MARIIVIEDSPVLQRLVGITMRNTGVDVEPYLDGSSGVEAAVANPPNLVVLDLGLPILSGWQVLERLRAEPGTFDTPVILTTGESGATLAARAASYDAVVLEKPYTGAVLRATILVLMGLQPVVEPAT